MTPLSRYALPVAERCAGTISAGQRWYGWGHKFTVNAETARLRSRCWKHLRASSPGRPAPHHLLTREGHRMMSQDASIRPTRQVTLPIQRATSVYRYYDGLGVLLYVGVTSRATRRNDEHNTKEWWQYVKRQDVEHYSTREEALSREKQLILEFRPPFNKVHNPDYSLARGAYLALVEMTPRVEPHELLKSLEKKIPLRFDGQTDEDGRLLLRTSPAHWPLAAQISPGNLLEVCPVNIGPSGPRVGTAKSVRQVGQSVHVYIHARKNMPEFRTAQARLKMLDAVTGTFRIARVLIDCPPQGETHSQRRKRLAAERVTDGSVADRLIEIVESAGASDAMQTPRVSGVTA